MKISGFVEYVKQIWKNKPDTSTPVSAERLNHIEEGIKANSDALAALAAVVCDQVLNDPEKIASLAALYSVDKKIGDTSNLPNSAMDVVTALTTLNSNFVSGTYIGDGVAESRGINTGSTRMGYIVWSSQGTAIIFYSGAYCRSGTSLEALDGAKAGSHAGGFWFKTDSKFLNADGVTYNYQSI